MRSDSTSDVAKLIEAFITVQVNSAYKMTLGASGIATLNAVMAWAILDATAALVPT